MKTDSVNTDCIKISIENIHNSEICEIFNFPSTIDIKPKEKN